MSKNNSNASVSVMVDIKATEEQGSDFPDSQGKSET
jgi:hypothetical protein